MINSWKGFVRARTTAVIIVLIHVTVESAEYANHKDDEAEPTTSIHPPFGNSLFLRLNASGVQIYKCEQSSAGLRYSTVGAKSKLYHPHGTKAAGYHYYLPRPIAQGGQPTFSFSRAEGDPISATPKSTITGIAVARMKAESGEDLDDVLVKAISHSGYGHGSEISYIQRRYSKGGAPPSYDCGRVGRKIHVPYSAQYFFWSQDRDLPSGVASEISVPGMGFSPLLSFYAEGFQSYTFNGTSWIPVNARAFLYNSPGQEVVGRHFYLEHIDGKGGQPSWEMWVPRSRVTAKVVNTIFVDPHSIAWTKLEATSYGREKSVGFCGSICLTLLCTSIVIRTRRYFGEVKYVQRLSTVGGLPPATTMDTGAKLGDNYMAPYSAIYWFYVSKL